MRDQELVNKLRTHLEVTRKIGLYPGKSGIWAVIEQAADRIANQSTHIAALQQEIEKLRGQVPRWIPVAERLPDQCMDVLVRYRDKHILMGTARCDDWIEEDFDDGIITHWMPLPEPPKEVVG